eukprot:9377149-Pyramimonas_sp.AAC.1
MPVHASKPSCGAIDTPWLRQHSAYVLPFSTLAALFPTDVAPTLETTDAETLASPHRHSASRIPLPGFSRFPGAASTDRHAPQLDSASAIVGWVFSLILTTKPVSFAMWALASAA